MENVAQRPNLLKDSHALERSEIVANSAMNRGRGIAGPNSYAKDLGFQCVAFLLEQLNGKGSAAWLDLCCGSGRALIQAAQALHQIAPGRYEVTGVDLVPMFDEVPSGLPGLTLMERSLGQWKPDRAYDLITCVHGLHYIGDKLGALCSVAGWLTMEGELLAHLDMANLRLTGDETSRHAWISVLRRAGFTYSSGRRLVRLDGFREIVLPYLYLGADDTAGPNSTGQPAVDSWYAVRQG